VKTWFYAHPNITFLLLGAWYLLVVTVTLDYLRSGRWGWFAVGVVASFSALHWATDWWRKRL
jgi:hypothetical protein